MAGCKLRLADVRRHAALGGLRRQRFHDLRHLFASLALSSGEDMGVVSKLLGHTTSQIGRDLFAHRIGGRARQAVDGVADLLPSRATADSSAT